jgi:hypothetical protein
MHMWTEVPQYFYKLCKVIQCKSDVTSVASKDKSIFTSVFYAQSM